MHTTSVMSKGVEQPKGAGHRFSFCVRFSIVVVAGAALAGIGRAEDKASGTVVKLERLTWSQFQQRLANPRVKYTIVDAWSTTCGPCKENFPHVVEMHRKYGPKGLAVVSLALDDPTDKAAVAEAEKF